MTCDLSKFIFLDLEIYINGDGSLGSSLFRNPSAGNTLLHATSSHLTPLLKSIPYSQYLHLQRNCTTEEDFLKAASDLYSRLRDRGYSHNCLKKAFNKTIRQDSVGPC